MNEEIRNTSESVEEVKKIVVMKIQVNETREMGEGRPRDDDGKMISCLNNDQTNKTMAEDVERDNVGQRRPRGQQPCTHAGALEAQGLEEFVEHCK